MNRKLRKIVIFQLRCKARWRKVWKLCWNSNAWIVSEWYHQLSLYLFIVNPPQYFCQRSEKHFFLIIFQLDSIPAMCIIPMVDKCCAMLFRVIIICRENSQEHSRTSWTKRRWDGSSWVVKAVWARRPPPAVSPLSSPSRTERHSSSPPIPLTISVIASTKKSPRIPRLSKASPIFTPWYFDNHSGNWS